MPIELKYILVGLIGFIIGGLHARWKWHDPKDGLEED